MTARVDPPLLVYPEQLDDKPRLMPCPNGVINLETGELAQGRPRDYLLKACETEYEPDLLDVEETPARWRMTSCSDVFASPTPISPRKRAGNG